MPTSPGKTLKTGRELQSSDVEEQPKTEQQQNTEPLLTYLEKQTKAQLVELLDELTDAFLDVREFLEDRRKVRSGNADTLQKAKRRTG